MTQGRIERRHRSMKTIRTGAKLARKSLFSGSQPLLFAQVRYGTIQQIPSFNVCDPACQG